MKWTGLYISAAIAAMLTGPAAGAVNEGWSFEISPYAWLSGLSGTLTLEGQDVDFHKSAEDMLEYVDAAGSLETIARYNRFVVDLTVDYFDLSTDELDANDQPKGGKLDAEMIIGELVGGFQLGNTNFTCDAMVGIRYLSLDNDLTRYADGMKFSDREELIDPVLILRPSIAIWPSKLNGVSLNVTGAIGGGGDSKLIYEIFPELRWQIGQHFLLRGGYRLAGWEYEGSGIDEIDLDISGLLFGFGVLF